MEREVLVVMDLDAASVPVGRLWTRTRGARETASFEYEPSWLSRRGAFGIDPELPLTHGPFHTGRPLFNAFADPAPDRWGQALMRRNERRRARAEGRQPRALRAIDEFDGTASLDAAFRIAPMFGIGEGAARAIAQEVGEAVGRWREVPTRLGLTPDEVERMSSAFEHEDLRALR